MKRSRSRPDSEIFNPGRFLPLVQARDVPITVSLFGSAQNVDQAVHKRMATDLRVDGNDSKDAAI